MARYFELALYVPGADGHDMERQWTFSMNADDIHDLVRSYMMDTGDRAHLERLERLYAPFLLAPDLTLECYPFAAPPGSPSLVAEAAASAVAWLEGAGAASWSAGEWPESFHPPPELAASFRELEQRARTAPEGALFRGVIC
jgi:hypothetical protein